MKIFDKRRRTASERMADDEIAAIEKELLAAIEDDDEKEPVAKEVTAGDLVDEASELEKYASEEITPDEKPIVNASEDDETAEVLKACDEVEGRIASLLRGNRTMTAAEEAQKEIADAEREIADAEKKASVEKKGIEDTIGDEASGSQPSVSTVVKNDVKCETPKQVVSENSEYIAKKCTAKLDRCADILERRGMKRFAFAIDRLSDEIEASLKKNNKN